MVMVLVVGIYSQEDGAAFIGDLSFDYTGAISGDFSASAPQIGDSIAVPTSFAGAAVGVIGDTTHILIPAFQQVTDTTYDLLITYLRDDSGGVESQQSWQLPGDLTDLSVFSAFIPEIDTALISDLFQMLVDTSGGTPDLDDLAGQLIDSITPSAYMGATGTIQMIYITPDSLAGTFHGSYLKTGFPPPMILVSNGMFAFSGLTLPPLLTGDPETLPEALSLRPAFPNPFNAAVTIPYSIARNDNIKLTVYDLAGHIVHQRKLANLPPGGYYYHWNPGHQPSGVYLVRLNNATTAVTQKLLLIK